MNTRTECENVNNKPAKPVTLIMDELKGGVVHMINESGLPPVLVEAAIKDVFSEVSRQTMIQRASEAESYLAALKEFDEKEKKDGDYEQK